VSEIGPHFDGETYEADLDHSRLSRQLATVKRVMLDGRWRTLFEIHALTREPEASISARLRDLRKEKFGGYLVRRRRRSRGLFEYKLLAPGSQLDWLEQDGGRDH